MVTAGHRIMNLASANAIAAPHRGVEVICMVPISLVHMMDAITVDGQDCQWDQGSIVFVGSGLVVLVLCMMPASKTLVGVTSKCM